MENKEAYDLEIIKKYVDSIIDSKIISVSVFNYSMSGRTLINSNIIFIKYKTDLMDGINYNDYITQYITHMPRVEYNSMLLIKNRKKKLKKICGLS